MSAVSTVFLDRAFSQTGDHTRRKRVPPNTHTCTSNHWNHSRAATSLSISSSVRSGISALLMAVRCLYFPIGSPLLIGTPISNHCLAMRRVSPSLLLAKRNCLLQAAGCQWLWWQLQLAPQPIRVPPRVTSETLHRPNLCLRSSRGAALGPSAEGSGGSSSGAAGGGAG